MTTITTLPAIPAIRTGGGAVAGCWGEGMMTSEKIISDILWAIAITLIITQLI